MYSSIQLWYLETDRVLHKPKYLEDITYYSVGLSPDGHLLALASPQSSVRIRDRARGAVSLEVHGNNDVNCVVFSLDGQKLATAAEDGAVRFFDPVSGVHLQTLDSHETYLISMAFSPDGKRLAGRVWYHSLLLWDLETGVGATTQSSHGKPIKSVILSPDGRLLASIAEDRGMKIWEVTARNVIYILNGHHSSVNCVTFSPESKYLISGSDDVSVWS